MASVYKPIILEEPMTFQEFEEYERKLQLQYFYEKGGMIEHEELTSEPFDFGDVAH